jgi:hypothetical protein
MAIKRITISIPESVARQLKKSAGQTPVSRWVTELIEDHLDDASLERQWQDFCRDVAPTGADDKRARAMFKRLSRKPARNRSAP